MKVFTIWQKYVHICIIFKMNVQVLSSNKYNCTKKKTMGVGSFVQKSNRACIYQLIILVKQCLELNLNGLNIFEQNE